MVSKIITHNRPHADELVALMMLKKFSKGEEKFPGVSDSKIEFLTTGELPNGKTAKDFSDTIFLGCGGGDFDEHATSQKDRVEGECCATLVAKYLGLEKNKELQKILTFIKSEDLKGTVVKNELPMMIKFLHSCHKEKYSEISKWVEDAYYAIVEEEGEKWDSIKNENDAEVGWNELKGKWQRPTLENTFELLKKRNYPDLSWWKNFIDEALEYQKKRFVDAQNEFYEFATVENIVVKKVGLCKIALITSDNEEMNKFARSIGIHIIVQFSTKGNCAIFTDRKKGIDLSFVFVLIRIAEQHYRGGIKIKDQDVLSKEGFVDGIPYWYLFRTKDMGFNGSLTTSDVEPTKIPKEKIFELVKEGIK